MKRGWQQLFETGRILRQALHEQQACIGDVYRRLAPYLATPPDTPAAYRVAPGEVPGSFFTWRKNLFSTLFHSTYLLLGCDDARRMLYGRLIHLYRIWVTAADNLLDDEDKIVVPIEMPGRSRIMRQVVAIMAADRVLAELLDEAEASGIATAAARRRLQGESLRRLLPSAAQEATEEGGIGARPDPEHVLGVIHRLKTGLLFNIAFVGPELLEPRFDAARWRTAREALMQFGLGCQLLDDVRDLARDLLEERHNYVLSWLAHREPGSLDALRARAVSPTDRLYLHATAAVLPAAERGFVMMRDGLAALGAAGLGFDAAEAAEMANLMFSVLDLGELHHA